MASLSQRSENSPAQVTLTRHLPSIYLIHQDLPKCLTVCEAEEVHRPIDNVVFKRLDHLVEEVSGEELMNVSALEVICVRLWQW